MNLIHAGINSVDLTALKSIGIAYGAHQVTLLLLVFGIYYPTYRKKNFVFTYYLVGTIVLFLSFVMNQVVLNVGFALGLFAVFGIIRYRTDQIPIREMTYLFLVIGISVLNGLIGQSILIVSVVNITVLVTLFIFEKLLNLRNESSKLMVYEKLENLRPENEGILRQDIFERTGIEANSIKVVKYDFINGSAQIKVYFHSKRNRNGKAYTGLR